MRSAPLEVRLGALLALTGPEAVYAREIRHALALAYEDAGSACDLLIADDHAEPGVAREAARRLADDPRVIAVVGPMNSWTCEPAGAVFADAGLPHITPSASNASLSSRGWSTFFRACPSDDLQSRALAAVAHRLLGARRVGAMDDGSSFAAPLSAGFLAAASARGLVPVVHASVAPGDTAALERAADEVLGAAPEAVLIAGLEDPCRVAARALRAKGVDAVFLGTDALKSSRPLRVAGHPSPWLTNSGTDSRRQAPAFHARMVARAGRHNSIYTVEAWEAARLLLEMFARGARTREAMRDGLAQADRHDGAPMSFAAGGERRDARIGVYVDEDAGLRFVGPAAELLDL